MRFSSSLAEAIHRFDAEENARFKGRMGRIKFAQLPRGYVPLAGLYTEWRLPMSANKGWPIDRIPEIENLVEERLAAKINRDYALADSLKSEIYAMGVESVSDGRS